VIAVGALAAGTAVALAGLAVAGVTPRMPLPALHRRDLALALVCAAGGVLAASIHGVAPVGLVAAAIPWWRRGRKRAARLRLAEASIIPVLEAIAGASRAGLVLRDALSLGRERARGELAERIADALAREELGASLAEAVGAVRAGAASRIDAVLADLQLCASARLGSDRVAALFEDVLSALRFERELAGDLRARTSGQRLQVWLLAAVVPLLALYLAAMSPTLADELSTPLGRGVLIPAGALFEIAGVVLTRRVVSRAGA